MWLLKIIKLNNKMITKNNKINNHDYTEYSITINRNNCTSLK